MAASTSETPQESYRNECTSNESISLLFSPRVGRCEDILDPEDLKYAFNMCPGKMGAKVIRIDDETVVKYGEEVGLAEAEAMHLIAEKTNIPTPKLQSAYVYKGVGYIVMSYEKGQLLDEFWEEATENQRESVVAQLKSYVEQMRAIKGSFIGGVDYSPCRDGMFTWDYEGMDRPYGPYDDEATFNEGIIEALRRKLPPGTFKPNVDLASSAYNWGWQRDNLVRSFKNHEIVFTHGDLNYGNILVRDDGTVVLLDWGLAGYWPCYWEFHKATWMGSFRPDFMRQFERFIPPYYMEAFVMRHLYDQLIG